MKITGLLLVVSVAGFYGCGNKETAVDSGEKTLLIEKIDQALGSAQQESSNLSVSGTRSEANASAAVAGLEVAAVDSIIDPNQLIIGKTIYSDHCMACHSAGIAGSPKVGDAAVWEPRIAQGMDTLYENALNGFTGKNGYMPPRGGFATLKDDEVKAAVAYMVSVSQ